MIKKTIVAAFLMVIALYQVKAQCNIPVIISNDIQLIAIKDSVYVHTTWYDVPNFGRVGANGLIIIKNGEAIMVDTPWNNDQTKRLTQFIDDSLNVKVVKLISGHYHDDCLGGLEYLKSRGVESIANSATVAICKKEGIPVPSTPFTDSLTINFNGLQVECRFFGGGHSSDNITVWIPEKRVLFGGCLIKSADAKNLGYTGEAVVDQWDSTVKKIIAKYNNIEVVVPGHGNYGDSRLLTHTIDLVEKFRLK